MGKDPKGPQAGGALSLPVGLAFPPGLSAFRQGPPRGRSCPCLRTTFRHTHGAWKQHFLG